MTTLMLNVLSNFDLEWMYSKEIYHDKRYSEYDTEQLSQSIDLYSYHKVTANCLKNPLDHIIDLRKAHPDFPK